MNPPQISQILSHFIDLSFNAVLKILNIKIFKQPHLKISKTRADQ
jgi:hypothetical protein